MGLATWWALSGLESVTLACLTGSYWGWWAEEDALSGVSTLELLVLLFLDFGSSLLSLSWSLKPSVSSGSVFRFLGSRIFVNIW